LLHLNKDQGVTLIVVTHNAELAQCMRRTLELRSGELYET
jgi:lipoprotein-releasing system ATP-binding protein